MIADQNVVIRVGSPIAVVVVSVVDRRWVKDGTRVVADPNFIVRIHVGFGWRVSRIADGIAEVEHVVVR